MPKTIPFGQASSSPKTIPFAPSSASITGDPYANLSTGMSQTPSQPLSTRIWSSLSQPTFPSTTGEGGLTAGAKAIGNLPSSAARFGKGLYDVARNPVDSVRGLASVAGGGIKKAAVKLGAPDKTVFSPEEDAKNEQAFDAFKSMLKERYGSLEALQKTATEDPFGFGTDIVSVFAGGATALGKGATAAKAIEKVGGAGVKVATAPVKTAGRAIAGTTKFSASQATGLSQETLGKIISDPKSFTKEAQASISRQGLANEIGDSLLERQSALSETGAGYAPIRQSTTPVKVAPESFANTIKKETGLEIVDGKVVANTTSKLRDASDVRAVQKLYDFWQPTFEKGAMTTEELLNFRTDLAELSKFERQIGKSQPLELAAQGIRGEVNKMARPQVKGLEELDAQYAGQITEFSQLKKGLIDGAGNLTDSAINRIANATGKGKDLLIDRLEQISPGVTDRIKTLKAVEDIQQLTNQIPGKYGRAGLFLGAAYTLNPWLAVGTIMALPEVAVPILRGIGMAKGKIQSTMKMLEGPIKAFKAINESPEAGIAPVNAAMRDSDIQPGLSMKADTSKGISPASVAQQIGGKDIPLIQNYVNEPTLDNLMKLEPILKPMGIDKLDPAMIQRLFQEVINERNAPDFQPAKFDQNPGKK